MRSIQVSPLKLVTLTDGFISWCDCKVALQPSMFILQEQRKTTVKCIPVYVNCYKNKKVCTALWEKPGRWPTKSHRVYPMCAHPKLSLCYYCRSPRVCESHTDMHAPSAIFLSVYTWTLLYKGHYILSVLSWQSQMIKVTRLRKERLAYPGNGASRLLALPGRCTGTTLHVDLPSHFQLNSMAWSFLAVCLPPAYACVQLIICQEM